MTMLRRGIEELQTRRAIPHVHECVRFNGFTPDADFVRGGFVVSFGLWGGPFVTTRKIGKWS